MMTSLRWIAAAVVLGLGSGTLARAADEPTGDLKAMQGAWTYTTQNGEEGQWTFEGDTVKVKLPSRNYVAKVSLDAKAKPNATVDFKINEGPDDAVGKTSLGIYKLDGDNLTFCIGGPDNPRPATFEAVEQQSYLFKLTKKK